MNFIQSMLSVNAKEDGGWGTSPVVDRKQKRSSGNGSANVSTAPNYHIHSDDAEDCINDSDGQVATKMNDTKSCRFPTYAMRGVAAFQSPPPFTHPLSFDSTPVSLFRSQHLHSISTTVQPPTPPSFPHSAPDIPPAIPSIHSFSSHN